MITILIIIIIKYNIEVSENLRTLKRFCSDDSSHWVLWNCWPSLALGRVKYAYFNLCGTWGRLCLVNFIKNQKTPWNSRPTLAQSSSILHLHQMLWEEHALPLRQGCIHPHGMHPAWISTIAPKLAATTCHGEKGFPFIMEDVCRRVAAPVLKEKFTVLNNRCVTPCFTCDVNHGESRFTEQNRGWDDMNPQSNVPRFIINQSESRSLREGSC